MELEYPAHLRHKFDKNVVKQIAFDIGIDTSGDIDKLIYTTVVDINKEDDPEEKEDKLALYHQFVLDTIKHGDNREILTFDIEYGSTSPLTSFSRLLNHLNVNREDFFVSKVMYQQYLSDDYVLIYRNTDMDIQTDAMAKISLVYGRRVLYKKPIKNTKRKIDDIKYEYIWIEIDIVNYKMRMIISSNEKNYIDGRENGTRNQIVNRFLPKLRNNYIFSIDNEANESHTLFKIYRELTDYIEKEYNDKISVDLKSEINDFAEHIKTNLGITDKEDIELGYRIEKLFERNLIKKDFERFINKKVREGRVLNVGFTDSVGGSVKANSGGKKKSVDGEIIFDLQDSDVYFDIKETIYSEKGLQSITVSWKNDTVLTEDSRYKEIIVKYTAFNGYFSTHFLRANTRKEIYNYVLPKFNDFKRR